jgi:HMG (high mobility group) box
MATTTLVKNLIDFTAELVSEYVSSTADDIKNHLLTKENKEKIKQYLKDNKIRQKKEKSEPSDSDLPKRPTSAFLLYSADQRKVLVSKNKDLSNKDITKLLSETWKNHQQSNSELFLRFSDEANQRKINYENQMKEYKLKNNLPEKEKPTKKKPVMTLEKPKGPFQYFVNDKKEEYLIDDPNMKIKEINEKAKMEWKELKANKSDIIQKYKSISKQKKIELKVTSATQTERDDDEDVSTFLPVTPGRSYSPSSPSPIRNMSPSPLALAITPGRSPVRSQAPQIIWSPANNETPNDEKKKKKKKKSNENGEKKKKKKLRLVSEDESENDN